MAPGSDGGLYVSIPVANSRGAGAVVALLGRTGEPRTGWPIRLPGVDGCDLLLPVPDGSVRVVCFAPPPADDPYGAVRRAFAFDESGRSIPGWPVDVDDGFTGRTVGDRLTLLVGGFSFEGGEAGDVRPVAVVTIEADGSLRKGADVPTTCCNSAFAIGPDGIAYVTAHQFSQTAVNTDLLAFGPDGPMAGWPVTIDGNASELAFDAQGRVYVVVGSPTVRPARTMVLDQGGQVLPTGSADLWILSTSTWNGAGADYPGAPIVAADGTAFIVETEEGLTSVMGLDPTGQPLGGRWPYQSALGMEWTGRCGEGDVGCGQFRTIPEVGSSNVLFLFNAAASESSGGSMVAIESDGQVLDGWPVGLRRAGAMFWSMTVAPEEGVWALAIEPETQGHSATILAIRDDSTVAYSTTIVEP